MHTVKLINNISEKLISPSELKTDQLAQIERWPVECYIGCVVFRGSDDRLISLDLYNHWTWCADLSDVNQFGLRVLPVGTKIEITVGN